jgi:hypothetical protein
MSPGMQRQATVHFGPFNAEAAWRDPSAASLPEVKDSQAQRIVAVLDELQFALCEDGDVLLTAQEMLPSHREYLASLGFRFAHGRASESPPPEISSRLAGARPSPYAVVPGLDTLCARWGVTGDLPPVEVVRKVNSKTYSHHLASSLSLFGAGCLVRSLDALSAEGSRLLSQGSFIVKDPFGVSGKGALIIRAQAELDRVLAHLKRQAEAGRFIEFLVQPVYDRVTDFSCHFEVTRAGLHRYGAQVMDNDGLAFAGVRPAPAELEERLERLGQWRVVEQVARALAADGYHGPVCIDAMLLRNGMLVPLLEINARKSMGLINHHLQERIGNGLRSHLGFLTLALRRRVTLDELLDALRRQGLLYDGARPGLLPLSGNAVMANLTAAEGEALGPGVRGRLYVAAMALEQAAAARLLDALGPCLEALGVDVPRRPRG